MGFAIVLVGSELLTGRRRDEHLAFAIDALGRRGLELHRATLLPDDPARITAELVDSMARDDVVFCFGGIGATPDDHTRRAAADAAGVDLARHPEAAAIIEERFGAEAFPQRIQMAHLPRGCELIPNPINAIAGFSVGDHHFVPGFPQMAWPMVEWVLDERYGSLHRPQLPVEATLTLPGVSEGQLIPAMQRFVQTWPSLRLSCLPHMEGDYRETELGIRGPAPEVAEAMRWLREQLREFGFQWRGDDC